MCSANKNIFTRLKEHARYVEGTIQKLYADLSTLDHPNRPQRTVEEILSVNLSVEADIDELLRQTQEENKESELVLTETVEAVSILNKQLEHLEDRFNMKPILIEAADHSIQIIVNEPSDDEAACLVTDDVKQERAAVDAAISDKVQESVEPEILDETTMLLRMLQMNKYEKLVTPPKLVRSLVLEEELAKQKAREENPAVNYD